jgi:hypothetical protein
MIHFFGDNTNFSRDRDLHLFPCNPLAAHGYYSREAKAERSRVRAAILALRYLRMLGH